MTRPVILVGHMHFCLVVLMGGMNVAERSQHFKQSSEVIMASDGYILLYCKITVLELRMLFSYVKCYALRQSVVWPVLHHH